MAFLITVLVGALLLACAQSPSGPSASSAEGVTRIPVGRGPSALALADLNADGLLDAVAGNETSRDVTVLLGDGRGGLRSARGSPFPAGSNPADIAVGDFDRDGIPDLAVANHETSLVTVLVGNGAGGFALARGSPLETGSRPHVHSVATADFDGDGNLDLVVESADTDGVHVLWGDGRGGYSRPAAYVVGDLPYFRVRAGDLDGDSRPDIAVALSRPGTVAVLRSDGRGGFMAAPGSPYPAGGQNPLNVAIGDLNGDRRTDLVVVHAGGLSILLGSSFRSSGSPLRAGTDPTNLALGDINGDGVLDLAVSNFTSNDVTLFLSGPSGPAATTRALSVGRRPKEVAVGDLDRDGRADVLVTDFFDDDIALWLSR